MKYIHMTWNRSHLMETEHIEQKLGLTNSAIYSI